MREPGRPGGERSVGEGGGAGQHRECARESGGGAQRQGSTGAVQRRVRGCRWVPKASAEEGMEARNGL